MAAASSATCRSTARACRARQHAPVTVPHHVRAATKAHQQEKQTTPKNEIKQRFHGDISSSVDRHRAVASAICCHSNNNATSQNRLERFVGRKRKLSDIYSLYIALGIHLDQDQLPDVLEPGQMHCPSTRSHRRIGRKRPQNKGLMARIQRRAGGNYLYSLIQSPSVRTIPAHPSGSADRIPAALSRGPCPPSRRTCVPRSSRDTAQTCG